MDESGVHDGSPVVTVAAYIGTAREWRGFISQWNREKGPVRVFHSADCQHLCGEFRGWNGEDRDAFVVRMLKVIRTTNIAGVAVGINMDDFRDALRDHPDLARIIGQPYGACFHWTLGSLVEQLDGAGVYDRLAIYHETNDYQEDARATFEFFREAGSGRRHMSLTFGSKAQFVPLQAADILAYECNRRLRDLSRPTRRALDAINPGGSRLILRYYNGDNIRSEMVAQLERARARGDL